MRLPPSLAALAAAGGVVEAALPTIEAVGNKFFTKDGNQFFMKGGVLPQHYVRQGLMADDDHRDCLPASSRSVPCGRALLDAVAKL